MEQCLQIYDGNLMLIFYVLIPYPQPIFGKSPYPLRFRAKILKKTRSTFRSRTLILKMYPYPLRSRTYNFKTNPFPLRSRFRTWVRERNGYGISTRTPDSGIRVDLLTVNLIPLNFTKIKF